MTASLILLRELEDVLKVAMAIAKRDSDYVRFKRMRSIIQSEIELEKERIYCEIMEQVTPESTH